MKKVIIIMVLLSSVLTGCTLGPGAVHLHDNGSKVAYQIR